MVVESKSIRLRNMKAQEAFVGNAKESTINNIAMLITESNRKFSLKGEEF